MLQKKELKEMVEKKLDTIALYSKFENLQKYIENERKEMVNMLRMMVEVYNYQHRNIIFPEDIIQEILKNNEEIYNDLTKWYNVDGYYFLTLQLLYN